MRSVTNVIVVDGVKVRVQPVDLDRDGISGEVEVLQQSFDQGIQPITQPTELGDTLKQLNQDDLEVETRMSGIDMRARLLPIEVNNLLALDALVALQVFPTKCLAFSRQKKRLSVSHKGLGRKEIVDLVSGKKEQDAKVSGGFGQNVKGFFGGNRQ